ncbi:hypothetical protein B0H14DRAFT_3490515 [Mycena olivaceomarginata]|nr:hypothetical protein B0H14DRAFT_3490515 [Mycena olivaceomarginata]
MLSTICARILPSSPLWYRAEAMPVLIHTSSHSGRGASSIKPLDALRVCLFLPPSPRASSPHRRCVLIHTSLHSGRGASSLKPLSPHRALASPFFSPTFWCRRFHLASKFQESRASTSSVVLWLLGQHRSSLPGFIWCANPLSLSSLPPACSPPPPSINTVIRDVLPTDRATHGVVDHLQHKLPSTRQPSPPLRPRRKPEV